jgi:hypothetical protein
MPRIIPEEEASTGGGSGVDNGSQSTFVFKPGGIASDNVYNSWASLYSDFSQVSGPKIIQIDDSVTSPALIPSGSYNLMDATIVGSPEVRDSYPIMQLEDGAIFTSVEEFQHLDLRGNSTTSSIVVTASKQLIFRDVLVSVLATMAPLVSSSSTLDVVLDRSTVGGSETVFDITAGTTNFYVENQSNITTDVVTSSIGSVVDFECVDSNVTISAQSGILGATNTNNLSDAEKVFYDNTGSGLTSSDVQGALSELAGASVGATSGLGMSRKIKVPGSGTLYLIFNEVVTSAVGIPIVETLTLQAGGIAVDVADAANDYDLEFLVNGVVRETVSLASTNSFASSNAFTYGLVSGDLISARLTRTAGSGKSDFTNINTILIYKNM